MADDKENEYIFTVNNSSGESQYTKKESELNQNEKDLIAGEGVVNKTEHKYKIGDRVIVVIGSKQWVFKEEWKKLFESGFASAEKPKNIITEEEHVWWYDKCPEFAGKHAMVIDVTDTQGISHYAL